MGLPLGGPDLEGPPSDSPGRVAFGFGLTHFFLMVAQATHALQLRAPASRTHSLPTQPSADPDSRKTTKNNQQPTESSTVNTSLGIGCQSPHRTSCRLTCQHTPLLRLLLFPFPLPLRFHLPFPLPLLLQFSLSLLRLLAGNPPLSFHKNSITCHLILNHGVGITPRTVVVRCGRIGGRKLDSSLCSEIAGHC